MRRAAAVIVVAVVATSIALVVVTGSSKTRVAGTNGVEAGAFAIVLPPGKRHCQDGEFVPAGADRLRMVIGNYDRPTPPIDITITRADGSLVLHNRTPAGIPQGPAPLPLGLKTTEPTPAAQICLRPIGGKIALGGYSDSARIEFLRPGSESWRDLAGTIVHRFGIGRPDWQGGWLLVLAGLLVAALWVLTARLLLREAGS